MATAKNSTTVLGQQSGHVPCLHGSRAASATSYYSSLTWQLHAANERGRVLLGQAREVPVTVVPARSPLRKSLSDPVPVQLTPGELQTLPADEAAARQVRSHMPE